MLVRHPATSICGCWLNHVGPEACESRIPLPDVIGASEIETLGELHLPAHTERCRRFRFPADHVLAGGRSCRVSGIGGRSGGELYSCVPQHRSELDAVVCQCRGNCAGMRRVAVARGDGGAGDGEAGGGSAQCHGTPAGKSANRGGWHRGRGAVDAGSRRHHRSSKCGRGKS